MARPADDFVILNKQRTHAIDRKELRDFVSRVTQEIGIEGRSFAIVLVTDPAMRNYNRTYRGYDKPTDVLSFRGEAGYLGDILISSETAYNQSSQSSTLSFETNVRRLILHGLLHLL